MTADEAMDCAGVRELAAELALGVASGGERAAAVAHLAGCAECRALVAELSDVADEVLQLAPEAEPPPGFETRVLTRLRSPGRSRVRRRLAVVAVVLAALAAGLLLGKMLFGDENSRLEREYTEALQTLGGKALAAGTLVDADGHRAGQVFLYEGHVSWLFVTVDDPGITGDFAVRLRRAHGGPLLVDGLHLENGRGSLGQTAPIELKQVRGVAVLDGAGAQRYTARFRFG